VKHAIDVAPLGELADPTAIVRLAVAAEASGWDGISIWDSTGASMGTAAPDPFVALAGVAAATSRLRLITSVVALPRRRAHLVAQAAATLDRLSGGRLVLGVGAGGDPGDFEPFGESFAAAPRVAAFETCLATLDATLREGRGVPPPVQQPRPPIWVGAMKPGMLRRAAAWDGWIAIAVSDDGSAMKLGPADIGAVAERIALQRAAFGRAAEPFDVAVFGYSEPEQPELVPAFGAAGATWWLESLSLMRGPLDELLTRVEAGPPGMG
jgi:alkanesulfonate monooxygenase SsuD/methylene tetrahydromethanopterin reductase-like flavin-dependent oxidoreductase (luciferase family)